MALTVSVRRTNPIGKIIKRMLLESGSAGCVLQLLGKKQWTDGNISMGEVVGLSQQG